jgi:hypothetical protein
LDVLDDCDDVDGVRWGLAIPDEEVEGERREECWRLSVVDEEVDGERREEPWGLSAGDDY